MCPVRTLVMLVGPPGLEPGTKGLSEQERMIDPHKY